MAHTSQYSRAVLPRAAASSAWAARSVSPERWASPASASAAPRRQISGATVPGSADTGGAESDIECGRAGDRQRVRGAARAVCRAAVSQLLAALQTSGLVRRAPLERDRRHHSLALTAAGTRALRSASALLRKEVGRLLADLPHPEADALARSLAEVGAALVGTPPPRRPAPPRPPAPPPRGSPPRGPHPRGPHLPGSRAPHS